MTRLLLALLFVLPLRADDFDVIQSVVANSTYHNVTATGSMEPSFNENYWLLSQPFPFKDVRVGDVILFWVSEMVGGELTLKLICHRVWRRSSGGGVVLTKGDGNQNVDPWLVTERDYMGTVVGWIKKPLDRRGQVGQP